MVEPGGLLCDLCRKAPGVLFKEETGLWVCKKCKQKSQCPLCKRWVRFTYAQPAGKYPSLCAKCNR